jgi:HEAT repeat protein
LTPRSGNELRYSKHIMYEDAFTPLEPLDELPLASPLPVDVEAMLAQLSHSDPSLRMHAARIFCDVEDARSIPFLVRLLADPCTLVRVSAAYALGRNSSPDVVELLIQALQTDWNGYVRKGLVWALGNARDPRGIPVLCDALLQDITAVRLWAASALGQLIPMGGKELLQQALATLLVSLREDPVAAVRSNCAWALGLIGSQISNDLDSETLIGALQKARREDPDVGVQDDALLALDKLGIQDNWDPLFAE